MPECATKTSIEPNKAGNLGIIHLLLAYYE